MRRLLDEGAEERLLERGAIAAIVVSLAVGAVLAFLNRTLGGPGDELTYYSQAARLIPFTDHYYGPGYFVALRVTRALTGLPWFESGKLLSWLSAVGVLLLTYRLLHATLPRRYGCAAVIMVALNPTVITMSYSTYTVTFGALLILAAVSVLVAAEAREGLSLLSGFLFGLAALTRFQATGFFIGAVVGALVWTGKPFRRRCASAAMLALAFVFPLAVWYAYLNLVQGGAPTNWNYVHLTPALGQFQQFSEVPRLLAQYGSFQGVLASPGAIPAIAKALILGAVKFPFRTGADLLLVAAAWLVPGACLLLGQPKLWRPWLVALAAGFVLTNLGSRDWLWYYLPVMPFLAYVICSAAAAFDASFPAMARRLQWVVLVGVLLVASPIRTLALFRNVEWPEWGSARRILVATLHDTDLVSSSTTSLTYGTNMRFTHLFRFHWDGKLDLLVKELREAGVTKLVISERHSLWENPELGALIADDTTAIPPGLHRDTLIVSPHRVAILTVVRP